ncbi:MAG: CBS domain-containing protein [Gammaproteobacteria bacterium]|nr:CBS domain-containing protein [Gammaproteobacteria bacterium]
MFGIYGVDGRRFFDTLEELRKVRETATSEAIKPATAGKASGSSVDSGRSDAYREVLKIKDREPVYHAFQLMSHPVHTLRPHTDIITAHRLFQERKVRQMPVINTQERLVGMISAVDLLRLMIMDQERVSYVPGKRVADLMEREVITADPVSDIRRIARVMYDYRLHGIPIVNDSELLVGIVTRGDVLRALFNNPPLNLWS